MPGIRWPYREKGLLDSRVPHELLDRLGIDTSVNQQRSERMAALVESDRPQKLRIAPLPLGCFSLALVTAAHARLARSAIPFGLNGSSTPFQHQIWIASEQHYQGCVSAAEATTAAPETEMDANRGCRCRLLAAPVI